jgi:phosphodiesterase/alkaline phosphatase D-like protein
MALQAAVQGLVSYGEVSAALSRSSLSPVGINTCTPLTGLSPNTRYYYSVMASTRQVVAGPLSFKTPPLTTQDAPGPGVFSRMWAIGDPGTGAAAQSSVRDAYLAYSTLDATDAWVFLGDNAYQVGYHSLHRQCHY